MEVIYRKSNNGELESINISQEVDIFEFTREKIGANYIEPIKIREDIFVLCDEEITLRDVNYEMKKNFWYDSIYDKSGKNMIRIMPQWIYGDIVFVGEKGNEFVGLNKEQIEFINKYLYE